MSFSKDCRSFAELSDGFSLSAADFSFSTALEMLRYHFWRSLAFYGGKKSRRRIG